MSNQRFKEYARSQAFGISLSLKQVSCLIHVAEVTNTEPRKRKGCYPHMHFGTYGSLCTKGFIEWRPSPTAQGMNEGPYATKAGLLMVELLKEAGYCLEDAQEVMEAAT